MHVLSIVFEVVGDRQKGLAVRSEQFALGDGLAEPFDHLPNIAFEDSGAGQASEEFGLKAVLETKDIGGLPDIAEDMKQVKDESDLEFLANQLLESSVAVGQGNACLVRVRITAIDFLKDLLDDNSLGLLKAGPDTLVLWAGRRLGVSVAAGLAEKAFDNLLGSTNPRSTAKNRCDGSLLLAARLRAHGWL